MYIDYTYIILVLPAVLFAMWASGYVKYTFAKYEGTSNMRRITGAQAARYVLDHYGCRDVRIEKIGTELGDHFDPRTNIIRLSPGVHDSTSCAAIGVACHEAGHAIQYKTNYVPIKARTAIIPITNLGSQLAMPMILIGLVLASMDSSMLGIAYLGIACFGLSTLFQLITLPVEFNASRRAVACIKNANLLTDEELSGAKKVLRAAALTYVAALAVSLMQLLRLLILVNRRSDD